MSMVRAWKNTLCAYHGASKLKCAQVRKMVSYIRPIFYNLEYLTLVN